MVECLTRDQGAAGSSPTGVTALCPRARHINPSLVLVQPRKNRPYITERFLMGPKESNQTKPSRPESSSKEILVRLHWNLMGGSRATLIGKQAAIFNCGWGRVKR